MRPEQNARVTCDECQETIVIRSIEEEDLQGNRVGWYFRCPRCSAKYPIASITAKGIKMLPRMKRLRDLIIESVGDSPAYEVRVEEYQRLLKAYQKCVKGPYRETEVVKRGKEEK